MLGVHRNLIAQVEVGRQLIPNELHGAVQQELQSSIIQLSQHPHELLAARQADIRIEAIGWAGVGFEFEPQQPDQGWVFDQEQAQIEHIGFAFVEFDQICGHERGARLRCRSGSELGWSAVWDNEPSPAAPASADTSSPPGSGGQRRVAGLHSKPGLTTEAGPGEADNQPPATNPPKPEQLIDQEGQKVFHVSGLLYGG